jgi:hypothetical protein
MSHKTNLQPVRNKETGKIDYIVRVADHKTAESAPGVIALEPHIHQLLGKYVIIRQRILDSVNPVPRPASLLVNSKGRPFTNVSEAVVRLHKKCGFTVAADEYGAQVRLPLGPTRPSYDLQP